jgi:fumarate hydratase class II
MLPVVAVCLLESIHLLSGSATSLAQKAIQGMQVNEEHLRRLAQNNPILATVLNPLIGYDLAAQIVKQAARENRTILEVAHERTSLDREELDKLLDPLRATGA